MIPNEGTHLYFVRHKGTSVATIIISVTHFSDFTRHVQSSSLLPILCFCLMLCWVFCCCFSSFFYSFCSDLVSMAGFFCFSAILNQHQCFPDKCYSRMFGDNPNCTGCLPPFACVFLGHIKCRWLPLKILLSLTMIFNSGRMISALTQPSQLSVCIPGL